MILNNSFSQSLYIPATVCVTNSVLKFRHKTWDSFCKHREKLLPDYF